MHSVDGKSKTRDFSTDLIIESAERLKKDGKLIFLMSPKFIFDKKIKKAIAEAGISIDGVFYLEQGSHYPLTSISSYLIIATKGQKNSTFTAKLSTDCKTNEIIYKNFCSKKEGRTLQLGKLVDYDEFNSFKALEEHTNLISIGRRTGLPLSSLKDCIKSEEDIKTIKKR